MSIINPYRFEVSSGSTKIDIALNRTGDAPHPVEPIAPNTGINTLQANSSTDSIADCVDQENNATGVGFAQTAGGSTANVGGSECSDSRFAQAHMCDGFQYCSTTPNEYTISGLDASEEVDLYFFCSQGFWTTGAMKIEANAVEIVASFETRFNTDIKEALGVSADGSGNIVIKIATTETYSVLNVMGINRS